MRFEDMEIWDRSHHLSVDIFQHLINLQDSVFKGQITSTGLLLPRTIAEAFSRATERERREFLNNAHGSCAQLRAQIYIGIEINYINADIGRKWVKDTMAISSMLTSLIKFMDRKAISDFNRVKPRT